MRLRLLVGRLGLFSDQQSETDVESGRLLAKWVFLAVLIGTVARVGAIVFYRSIGFVTHHALGDQTEPGPP